ncbi:DUF2490 domain-containing protein [Paraflavisolibacter sp. H34]|uniref:DUF2490 domain-containing protein n=1 Tax=Huijunlia imazamoxiresistens TaxID=3127457 RepID=UPI0030194EF2
MNRILPLFVAFVVAFSLPAGAQTAPVKQTASATQLWAGYFNQTRFSNRWGLWFDGHLRTKEALVEDLSQGIARVGLTYYLDDATKLTAGYAFVNHFPSDNHPDISQPEHRPWQQVQWHTKYAKSRTMQWFRLEERYRRKIEEGSKLGDGYAFNFRIRYNFMWQHPLSKKGFAPKTLAAHVNNEVHVNFGKEIVNNYFDQNRFFVGLAYHVNKHDNLQVGYMNLFQQLPASGRYRSLHTARIFYFHNLDLRKAK